MRRSSSGQAPARRKSSMLSNAKRVCGSQCSRPRRACLGGKSHRGRSQEPCRLGGRSAREKELAKPTDKVVRGTAIEPPFSTESESIGARQYAAARQCQWRPKPRSTGGSGSRRSSIGLQPLIAGEGTGYFKTNLGQRRGLNPFRGPRYFDAILHRTVTLAGRHSTGAALLDQRMIEPRRLRRFARGAYPQRIAVLIPLHDVILYKSTPGHPV